MANYVVTDQALTSVANAIRTKGGTTDTLHWPNEFVSAIRNIPTGGSGGGAADVIFIDYDGTIVATKSKAEINAMTSDSDLPENPVHEGLTSQGWNWTVAQLKTQLTAMPDQKVYVGQMYVTQSGATEIDVSMQKGRLAPILTICVNGTVTVDWGDNTTPDTVTGTSETTRQAVSHTYASEGDYTISISNTSGTYSFYGNSNGQYMLLRKTTTINESRTYANCVQAIRLGNGISNIRGSAFLGCYSLSSVTIPSSVTSIGTYVFNNCQSLSSVTIPSGVTSIGNNAFNYCYSLLNIAIPSSVTSIGTYVFQNCYSLSNITIPSGVTSIGAYTFGYCSSLSNIIIPNGVTSIGNSMFYNCYSLSSITIPNSVTSIETYAFGYCYSLSSITIPSSVTSIEGSAFYGCSSISSITIPDGVTSIGTYVFYQCYSLSSVAIPSSVTSIESYAFCYCTSLSSITIPNSVTSIETYAFGYCYSLSSVTIPSSVTSIGNGAFANCYGVAKYHLLPTTIPTSGTTVFKNIVSDCKIYVPYSEDHSILAAYQSETNWSSYVSYIYEEPAP